jgi:hypothetical protein
VTSADLAAAIARLRSLTDWPWLGELDARAITTVVEVAERALGCGASAAVTDDPDANLEGAMAADDRIERLERQLEHLRQEALHVAETIGAQTLDVAKLGKHRHRIVASALNRLLDATDGTSTPSIYYRRPRSSAQVRERFPQLDARSA